MHLVPCQHSLSAPGGGTGGDTLDGDKNQNPKNSLWLPSKPPKDPWIKNLPPQKSLIKFPESKTSLVVFIRRTTWLGYARTTTNLQIVLAKETLAKLPYPKKSWNQKFQTPKNVILLSSPSLEIWSNPLGS